MFNRYAKRVESEHPIQIWPFDVDAHYVSLVTEGDRDMSKWALTNCTAESIYDSPVPGIPHQESIVTTVIPETIANESPFGGDAFGAGFSDTSAFGTSFSLESPITFSESDIFSGVEVAVSVFVKLSVYSIYYIEIGSTNLLERNYIPSGVDDEWVKITGRCLVSDGNIVINFFPFADRTVDELTVHVNGLTLGQYSEPTSSYSLGVPIYQPPTTLTADNPTGTDTLPSSYSIKVADCPSSSPEMPGYYVAKNQRLLAYNASIPLAYGSKDAVRLRTPPTSEEGDYPSLIIDGAGFLNELGRYDTYTVEFWLRIVGSSSETKKIFGPTQSSDGLYVTESIMSLSIGDNVASSHIGDMSDPMLIHIVYGDGLAEVLVNGEKMIAMSVDPASLTLPKVDLTHNQKWLGFWCYKDLEPIYVDCFSIFGYKVNEIIAKRRFIWGQGVADVGYTNTTFNGQTAYADFATSNATTNISYPDNSFWYNGQNKNLATEKRRLGLPEYSLPEFVFSSKTLSQWYADMHTAGKTDFWMRPSAAWDNEDVYIRFNPLSKFINGLKGISMKWQAKTIGVTGLTDYQSLDIEYTGQAFGDLDTDLAGLDYGVLIGGQDTKQPLILIRSKSTPTTNIDIYTDTETLFVKFNFGNTSTTLLQELISVDIDYLTYINLESLTQSFSGGAIPQQMINFLTNKNDIEVLVGGDGTKTFDGIIYNFSFIDQYYNSVISPNVQATYTWAADELIVTTTNSHGLKANDILEVEYLTGGMVSDTTGYARVKEVISSTEFTITKLGSGTAGTMQYRSPHFVSNFTTNISQFDVCSYTLLPKTEFGRFYADIGVRGYWSDYVPLQRLAGTAYDEYGNPGSALDLIQFNMGYPVSNATIPMNAESWSYTELMGEGYTYSALGLLFDDYGSLSFTGAENSSLQQRDTSNSFVKAFISFQGSNDKILDFHELGTHYPATTADLVYANLLDEKQNSKIEVVDGTSIIPPRNKRVEDMVMATYLEIIVPGIKTYPVALRSLEIASFAMRRDGFTPIGSKYQKTLYPFVTNGFFYDFNSIAPFKINKRGLPLFYQGEESGFTPLGTPSPGTDQGMFIDFSVAGGSQFEIDSVQLWVKRNDDFQEERQKVFEIVAADSLNATSGKKVLSFYLERYFGDPDRAIIRVYNELGNEVTHTGETLFSHNGSEVNAIILSKKEWSALGIRMNTEDRRKINGKLYLNIMSGLTYNNISVFQPTEGKEQLVQYQKWLNTNDEHWDHWVTGTWSNVLSTVAEKIPSTSIAKVIYEAYIGQQSLSVDSASDFRLTQDTIRHYADNSWLSQTLIPT